MPKETIELSEEDAAFIREAIARGEFANVNDVVRRGVQSLREREARRKEAEEKLRDMLNEGLESGRCDLSFQEIWAEGVEEAKRKKGA